MRADVVPVRARAARLRHGSVGAPEAVAVHRDVMDTATAVVSRTPEVYCWCMSRTNIDIDEEACAAVMQRYGVKTKREAVNLALRLCVVEPLSTAEALALEGTGWEGDLDQMREMRPA